MKKWLSAFATVLIVLAIALILLPQVFHGKIKSFVQRKLESSIHGHVSFDDIRVSFYRNFPNITVSVANLDVVSKEMPEDSLLYAREISFVMDSYEYISKGHYDLKNILLHEPKVEAHIRLDGYANFSIIKEDTTSTDTTSHIVLNLEEIKVESGSFRFIDEHKHTSLVVNGIDFKGSGKLSETDFDLNTSLHMKNVSLTYAGDPYFENKEYDVNLALNVDQRARKFSIKNGDITINDFPLQVSGTYVPGEDRHAFDLKFESPQTTLHELLSLTTFFRKDLHGIHADGKVAFNGFVKGDYVTGTDSIPTFEVMLKVNHGKFKKDRVKDRIEDIHLDLVVSNRTGHVDSTSVAMDSIFLRINDHSVKGHAHFRHLKNTMIDAALSGALHVEELLEVYPIDGVVAEGQMNFDLIVKGQYARHDGVSRFPHLDFELDILNGKLKYDSLTDSLSNVFFHMQGHTPQGDWHLGVFQVRHLKMFVGDNPIEGRLNVTNLLKPEIEAYLNANIRAEDLARVFPIDSLEMRGTLQTIATIKGLYHPSSGAFPNVTAEVSVDSGYLKTPNHHEALENIFLKAKINNTSGRLSSTSLVLEKLNYRLSDEEFQVKGIIKDFQDFEYDLHIKGLIDLEKLTKIYPIEYLTMAGLIQSDIEVKGTLSDLKRGAYERTKATGVILVENLVVDGRNFPHPVVAKEARLRLTPEVIYLDKFRIKTGRSSFTLSGQMSDYFGFFHNTDDLVDARLDLTADTLDLDEWKIAFASVDRSGVSLAAGAAPQYTAWQVPENIHFVFDSKINFVHYEDMKITDMQGEIVMKDGTLTIQETGFNSLDARFMASGVYDSRDLDHPVFDFTLDVEQLDIQRAYNEMKLVRELLPAAADAEGMFSINYQLKGELDDAMFPVTSTLTGGGEMHVAEARINGMKIFEHLSKAAKRKEINDPHLRDFTMTTEIRNNKIFVKPFNVKISGFNTVIEGVTDIRGPVEYLVKVQLGPIHNLNIPFHVSGTYDNPKVALGKGHKLPEEGAASE